MSRGHDGNGGRSRGANGSAGCAQARLEGDTGIGPAPPRRDRAIDAEPPPQAVGEAAKWNRRREAERV